MDNPNWKGNPDRDRISLDEDYEVRYWSHKWGISPEQLTEAEQKAGSNIVRKVHDALCELGYMKPQIGN
ncbi:DUF3606 domain-containing protein [Pararcticibacter amylolyticus]|uniref:DUF3606 domain-containing protein n=1 Tax=Pararcticibacter amylolyticus TaxID=2173175 RepID=A0A2U2PBA8_9SPHI|nr:DUF3606 domain-containing protein [Pararcticibacter amylolyticus]PWG78643.1 DUF3606 domain-containing protein [Pararcticibacter amylolyticus]